MLVVPAELIDVLVSAERFAIVLDVIQIRFVLCRPPQPRRSPQQLILSGTHTRQGSYIKLVSSTEEPLGTPEKDRTRFNFIAFV